MTLIELLIVLSILAMAAGFIGININKTIREQRFKSEVNQVLDYLKLAQDIMLILNADVKVVFRSLGEKNEYWIETDYPLPEQWARLIKQSHKILNSVNWVQFADRLKLKVDDVEGQLSIHFKSGGTIMSEGDLRLSTSEHDDLLGALTSYIILPGHPTALKVSKTPMDDNLTPEEIKVNTENLRLTEFTKQEILEANL